MFVYTKLQILDWFGITYVDSNVCFYKDTESCMLNLISDPPPPITNAFQFGIISADSNVCIYKDSIICIKSKPVGHVFGAAYKSSQAPHSSQVPATVPAVSSIPQHHSAWQSLHSIQASLSGMEPLHFSQKETWCGTVQTWLAMGASRYNSW